MIRSCYQRKQGQPPPFVALKAVAHKLARACYHVVRTQVPFELNRAVKSVWGGVGSSQRGWGTTPHSRLAPAATPLVLPRHQRGD